MVLYGEGGTGKSKVIQTITAAFEKRGVHHLLQKSAYTGNTASLIGGQTMHSLTGMSAGKKGKVTSESKRKLEDKWKNKAYLIIDECSMIGKTFLAQFARKIRIGCQQVENDDKWADLNVILCGDFHQFPPVATSAKDYLYTALDGEEKSMDRKEGKMIYKQFTTVVILTEQKRVTDPIWHTFLQRLRKGDVLLEDITWTNNYAGDRH
jgi:ATP-dependent exoDNAse (exonuclease V) alpha subunit